MNISYNTRKKMRNKIIERNGYLKTISLFVLYCDQIFSKGI